MYPGAGTGGIRLTMSFLTEYLQDRPDRLPERETLDAELSRSEDFGHASIVLDLLAEHDRRARVDRQTRGESLRLVS